MMSKRGEGLSLNFIIVAILALIALIVIALFFTGGITKLFGTEQEVTEISLTPQIRALAESSCELHCTNQNENAYNNPSFPTEVKEAGYTSCEDLLGKGFDACKAEKSCQRVDSESAVNCIASSESACNSVEGCVWK